ncbi:Reverse transcriptase [Phytophthora palmivora]|uniref:Reverse transcriptase n=1 Tax=Phytophthora palmivora TaxID=4796 RepID=A0A2P4XEL4_9STRA|nr:Reverse transcriptase [Phytophthora palmivora]
MDVDEDAWWPAAARQPLSPPPELRIGGKLRRLNDVDDEGSRERAELLLLDEDEAGSQDPALRLSAASQQQDTHKRAPVLRILSRTTGAVKATATAATAKPDSPHLDHTELAASPPAELLYYRQGSTAALGSTTAQRDRLLRPVLAVDEETKDGEEAKEDKGTVDSKDGEWLLRFDGACRANPGPGGAGASLFKPSGLAPDNKDIADIADGEVYTAMCIGQADIPQRRPRLRLRQLSEGEGDAVREMVERLGTSLAAKSKITDAADWKTAGGYITTLPHLLYDKQLPYSQKQRHPDPLTPQCGEVDLKDLAVEHLGKIR